jgi:hypothetical protein
MKRWKAANYWEKEQFESIELFFKDYPGLMEFVFDPELPRLRKSQADLLKESASLGFADDLLVRVAIYLWCGSAAFHIHKIVETLDREDFHLFVKSLMIFWPKPPAKSLQVFATENYPGKRV